VRYDTIQLSLCAQKLTGSQHSLPYITKNIKVTNARTKTETDEQRNNQRQGADWSRRYRSCYRTASQTIVARQRVSKTKSLGAK